ncbi:CBS domain-containing protein CBSX6 [Silene latifolia]|uniref:CBS domain-containing protein CBSX6 n=1 Tax=Silene latifolia TaxID=37657 RepID=UPI003D77B054
MASVFVYQVVGDLTVGKPELVEFLETETVESAIKAIGESTEGGIPVWRKKPNKSVHENSEMRLQRFVGILNPLDIVAFLAKDWCLEDQEKAMKTPVSEIVVPNNSLLKEVDPATRLIDALDMLKQGVKRLLVPKSVAWKCVSKKFSILYNGKWLKNIEAGNSANNLANLSRPSSSTNINIAKTKFCCLSREDVIRFLIGCLGALAPVPLTSISSLGAISPHYTSIEASHPAIESTQKLPLDPVTIAVVEPTPEGQYKIIGEISACKLWKCDYLAAAYALANLSAGQFVMGVEDNVTPRHVPDLGGSPRVGGDGNASNESGSGKLRRKFSSRSIGFFSNAVSPSVGHVRSMYRGRSAPLTCKVTSSLAAVMAQMLSHRATHVWVTEGEDDVLVGVVGYGEILHAVTRSPQSVS